MSDVRTKLAACFETIRDATPDLNDLLAIWSGDDHAAAYTDGRLWVERDGKGRWIPDDEADIFLAWTEGCLRAERQAAVTEQPDELHACPMTIQERVAGWVKEVGTDKADVLLCEFIGKKGSIAVVGLDGIIYGARRGVRLTDTECAAFLAWVEARVVVLSVDEAISDDGRPLGLKLYANGKIWSPLDVLIDPDSDPSNYVTVYEYAYSPLPDLNQLNELKGAKP